MITSLQNSLVKQIVALRDAKERRTTGLTLIDGVREIERALTSGVAIKHLIYCSSMFGERHEEKLLAKSQSSNIDCLEVSDKVFAKIAFGDRVEGVLAIAQTPLMSLAQLRLSKNPLIVVLESVEKPGNLGAILRSCDGAGVEVVLVCDPKTDIYNPNVIRASTGILFGLPVIADTSAHIQDYLKQNNITIVAATPHADHMYTKADYRKPTAFVLGTEDKGLSQFWMESVQTKVVIPMNGSADSLNVSVSAALLVYEALRQRTT